MKLTTKIVLSISIILLIISLVIVSYTHNPYIASDAMYDALTVTDYTETSETYQFSDEANTQEIIIIPGGLVDASAYLYLGSELFTYGYDVTIIKPPFYLAIISPNQAKQYISSDKETILIGHSLGGVVAGSIASSEDVESLVLLASYATNDVTDMPVLSIRGSNDLILDSKAYNDNFEQFSTAKEVVLDGGNHSQFGWYGHQKGDGEATLTPKQQQDLIINEIITFLGGNYDN
ncbi:MAG: alpha/beta hydrolase [Candidatus Izemoplasma sp.]|nr:alpha/beta hydrolase [Candidatus Izemoplasma sp.]